ncbi:hypothetical protein FFF93_006220 [Arthrobacter sp. KBS0702]|nr:hypothetical protein FFF93_006220 [Arthrobacter sp. KBS0702]
MISKSVGRIYAAAALAGVLAIGAIAPASAADGTPAPSPTTTVAVPQPTPSPSESATGGATPVPTSTSTSPVATPTATTAPMPSAAPTATVPTAPAKTVNAAVVSAGIAAIDDKWAALGGATGSYGPALAPAECGLAADGCKRDFTSGSIYWTATTGAVAVWNGAIGGQWKRLGAEGSWLKYPLSAERCGLAGDGCSQDFQSGTLYWSPRTGAFPTGGGIGQRWNQIGGVSSRLGYPAGLLVCGLAQGGCVQRFERGSIGWTATAGAWEVGGGIGLRWLELNAQDGGLGYPTSREICGLTASGCFQNFQRGTMMWSPASGAQPTWGAIRTRWAEYGYENSWMGYPVGRETCGLPGNGCLQEFQRATFYWSPATGAQPSSGAIRGEFQQRGSGGGALGYPNSPEYCSASGCRQYFQWGWLDWEPSGWVMFHLNPVGYCEALNRGGVKYGTAGAQRVSFAIAERYVATPVSFATCLKGDSGYTLEWNVPGYAGESGFAWAGVPTGPTINKYSPTGSFTVTDAFGLGNPGTKLNYLTLNSYSRWGGRLNGNYNKYFESSADVFPDENMWYYATRPSHDYRQGVVINYNRPPDSPIVMNAGFAIFLHANRVPTWGCISLLEDDVTRYIRSAAPGDRIVMGVGGDVFR